MLQSAVPQADTLKNGQTTFGKEKKVRRIALSDITDVKVGVNSTATLKGNNLGVCNDGLFFSLITSSRSLDFKANEVKTRNKWV
jgi:hypothetical protein